MKKGAEVEFLAASAPEGKLGVFGDPVLAKHLGLAENDAAIQHFDTTCSRWVTILSNSPYIRVRAGSVLHLRRPGVPVPLADLVDGTRTMESKPAVKQEVGSIKQEPQTSPTKRKSSFLSSVVDLTIEEDTSDKRARLNAKGRSMHRNRSRSPSPLVVKSSNPPSSDVGSVPAKLSRYPARTLGQMHVRLKWINNDDGEGVKTS